ncbi:hypothetical protein ACFCYB_32430 [Streptomyces sp. NPDC056309]|uniref:hypothetical protein n=1 Tax=Streptomyces sp. NPDC056309 TaxID=3345781 RepID=UPI0035DC00FB
MLFLAWIVFTAGTLLAFAIPLCFFWPLLLLVYVTVGVQSALTKLAGETGSTFVAAVVLAAAATLIARGPRRPPRLILILPGFFTLTVGSLGMRGLTTLVGGYVEGFQDLLKLVTIVTALATGLVVGEALTQGHSETWARRHHDPRTGSPHRAGLRGPHEPGRPQRGRRRSHLPQHQPQRTQRVPLRSGPAPGSPGSRSRGTTSRRQHLPSPPSN